ncbi:hypothetical protein ACFWWT_20140 [Streptomyces sp. NPDC058676]|uniref:hypothetical protein n=1 Tax=unclassified Streptomyces TaxID=2593676 RepID=UPI003649FC66
MPLFALFDAGVSISDNALRKVSTTPNPSAWSSAWWRAALSVLAWWAVVTLTLWLLGEPSDQPAQLAPCAASAAVPVAIGETGGWLRRRARARLRETRC